MKNLLKAELECKGCIGYCIPSRGGVIIILHLVLKMPTAQHHYSYTKQELHQTRARMHEATEPDSLEELNPQYSGQAVAQEDGDLAGAHFTLLSGDRRSRLKQQTPCHNPAEVFCVSLSACSHCLPAVRVWYMAS